MNRNRMKLTSAAISIAPEATRKPPTPSTTMNDACIAIPAIGTIAADARATFSPAR